MEFNTEHVSLVREHEITMLEQSTEQSCNRKLVRKTTNVETIFLPKSRHHTIVSKLLLGSKTFRLPYTQNAACYAHIDHIFPIHFFIARLPAPPDVA